MAKLYSEARKCFRVTRPTRPGTHIAYYTDYDIAKNND